jgi:hypothetical protein
MAPAVAAERDYVHDPSELSCLYYFCWKLILVLECIWNKNNVCLKLLCFCYYSTYVVITMLNTDVYQITYEMDVTCNLLCRITTILACILVGLKSPLISLDYRSYMDPTVRIWLFRWLFLYLCSYNLDGSVKMVIAQGEVL